MYNVDVMFIVQGMQKQLIEMQKKKSEDEAGPPKPKVGILLYYIFSYLFYKLSTYLSYKPT